MKLLLKTDFIDYYDHHFDILINKEPHHVFKRMSRAAHRKDAFEYLKSLGENVVTHGTVTALYDRFGPTKDFVVYTDPYAHAGTGKEKMGAKDALSQYPNSFASVFIPHKFTIRRLQLGHLLTKLQYSSSHPWKSNVGDVSIDTVHSVFENMLYNKEFPLLAIDYVGNYTVGWFAIDLNTAPMLKWSPVENDLTADEVVTEIRDWMEWKHGFSRN